MRTLLATGCLALIASLPLSAQSTAKGATLYVYTDPLGATIQIGTAKLTVNMKPVVLPIELSKCEIKTVRAVWASGAVRFEHIFLCPGGEETVKLDRPHDYEYPGLAKDMEVETAIIREAAASSNNTPFQLGTSALRGFPAGYSSGRQNETCSSSVLGNTLYTTCYGNGKPRMCSSTVIGTSVFRTCTY